MVLAEGARADGATVVPAVAEVAVVAAEATAVGVVVGVVVAVAAVVVGDVATAAAAVVNAENDGEAAPHSESVEGSRPGPCSRSSCCSSRRADSSARTGVRACHESCVLACVASCSPASHAVN